MNKQTVKLRNVANYSTTRISASDLTPSTYVGTDNINQNKTGKTDATYTPTTGNVSEFQVGDILIGNIRPYLKKIWYADIRGGSSADVLTIRTTNDKFDSKFIYYALFRDDFFDYMMQGSKGSKMPRGDKKQVLDFPIPDIEKTTQQKIAGVLSALDDKIELNRRESAELEQMARTLYDYWFVQFDFPDAHGKPYKSSGGPMKHAKELNRQIPADWEVKTLSELLSKRTESAEPNASLKCIDLSVIPSSNISIADYNEGDAFNSNMKRMYKNDILFGSIRPYLKKAGLAPFNGLRAGTVHAFYAKKASNIEHSLITMTGENFFNYAISRSGGSTRMPSVSADSLLEYAVPYDAKVVGEYHKMFSSLTDTISHNIVESQNLATLRDWLLPMLMNGQVSVE